MTTPEGRSYAVEATNPVSARMLARTKAARAGHRAARTCRVLHIERIDEATFEVVLEAR